MDRRTQQRWRRKAATVALAAAVGPFGVVAALGHGTAGAAADEPPAPEPTVVATVPVERPGVPSVIGSAMCVSGGGTINLSLGNVAGDLPITFQVTHPVSAAIATQVVAPGTNQQLTVIGTPSGTVHLAISADGVDLSRAFEITCPLQDSSPVTPKSLSSGTTPQPSRSLPETGGDVTALLIALGLVASGVGVTAVVASRRSTREH